MNCTSRETNAPLGGFLVLLLPVVVAWVSCSAARLKAEDVDLGAVLRRQAAKTGSAPTVDDFAKLIEPLDFEPNRQTILKGWGVLKELQKKPMVTLDELSHMIRMASDSITDFEAEYEIIEEEITRAGRLTRNHERYHCAHSEGQHYLKSESMGDVHSDVAFSVSGYDGTTYRRYFQRNAPNKSNGSIEPLEVFGAFYPSELHPLCEAMLVDSQKIFGRPLPGCDMVALLNRERTEPMVVYEKTKRVHGADCLVAANDMFRVGFDTAHGFALRTFEVYESDERHHFRLRSARDIEELADCGNGIWLPRRIRRDRFKNGVLWYQTRLNVSSLRVNQPIAKEVFRDIIPSGVMVYDGVRNLSYISGADGSIDHLLLGATPRVHRTPPRSGFLLKVLAINLVVFALIVAAIWWARRSRN
jgi:hypothetical protein